MKDAVARDELAAADLVFVDDSDELGRAQTIMAIADSRPLGIPVVIHDLERRHIRRSATFSIMFSALTLFIRRPAWLGTAAGDRLAFSLW